MLLGDNTTSGSQRIQRYDPVNRVTLGTFGQGLFNQNIQSIAVDSRTTRAYVLDAVGIVRVFNYNTGDFLDAFTTNTTYRSINFDAVSGNLTFGGGFGVGVQSSTIFSTEGAPLVNFANGGDTVYFAPIRRGTDSWFQYWGLNPGFQSVFAARRLDATSGAQLSGSVNGQAVSGGEAVRSSMFFSNGSLGYLRLSAGNLILSGLQAGSNGYIGSTFELANLGASTNENVNMVRGHGEQVYILNGNSLIGYHSGIAVPLGSHTMNFATASNIRGMAIIVAPEPTSLAIISIGFGIAGLLRRRKST